MKKKIKKFQWYIIPFVGAILTPLLWILLKSFVGISDRYLPSIKDVFFAVKDIEPNVFLHTFYTISRLIIGTLSGIFLGISLGLFAFKSTLFRKIAFPSIQSIRAIPPIATVPFFILWFGFSETGKYIMVILGIALNIGIATHQILTKIPEKYEILFKSFKIKPRKLTFTYSLPTVFENILPTIRFSLSTAIGLVVVSELLGAQVGLGYLIQTSRSTFSMHVVFLAAIILGIINFLMDYLVRLFWKRIIFWR